MQYYYIVIYWEAGDMTMCKIGLNPYQLTEWGEEKQQDIQNVFMSCLDKL